MTNTKPSPSSRASETIRIELHRNVERRLEARIKELERERDEWKASCEKGRKVHDELTQALKTAEEKHRYYSNDQGSGHIQTLFDANQRLQEKQDKLKAENEELKSMLHEATKLYAIEALKGGT